MSKDRSPLQFTLSPLNEIRSLVYVIKLTIHNLLQHIFFIIWNVYPDYNVSSYNLYLERSLYLHSRSKRRASTSIILIIISMYLPAYMTTKKCCQEHINALWNILLKHGARWMHDIPNKELYLLKFYINTICSW